MKSEDKPLRGNIPTPSTWETLFWFHVPLSLWGQSTIREWKTQQEIFRQFWVPLSSKYLSPGRFFLSSHIFFYFYFFFPRTGPGQGGSRSGCTHAGVGRYTPGGVGGCTHAGVQGTPLPERSESGSVLGPKRGASSSLSPSESGPVLDLSCLFWDPESALPGKNLVRRSTLPACQL